MVRCRDLVLDITNSKIPTHTEFSDYRCPLLTITEVEDNPIQIYIQEEKRVPMALEQYFHVERTGGVLRLISVREKTYVVSAMSCSRLVDSTCPLKSLLEFSFSQFYGQLFRIMVPR